MHHQIELKYIDITKSVMNIIYIESVLLYGLENETTLTVCKEYCNTLYHCITYMIYISDII